MVISVRLILRISVSIHSLLYSIGESIYHRFACLRRYRYPLCDLCDNDEQ